MDKITRKGSSQSRYHQILILELIITAFATATFTHQETSQDLTIHPMQSCEIRAALPIKIRYHDYPNGNCINSKIRSNQPFGLYTSLKGFVKWETLHRAFDCNLNYFHHSKCNITTRLPQIEESLELNVWRNCSWDYVVRQRPVNRHFEMDTQNWRKK